MKEKQSKREKVRAFSIGGEELQDVVSRAKEGSVEDFQKLYEFFARKILNYIYRMTGSREEAEDLTQETFVLAYTHLSSLQDNAKFQSWLFRIAQNSVYQKYRGMQPIIEAIEQEETSELTCEVNRLSASQASPENRVLSQELEQIIKKAIQQLPQKYKQVFVLSAIHKLTYSEISHVVNRSLASVKSDIHRARVEVRDKIKSYLGKNYGVSNLF